MSDQNDTSRTEKTLQELKNINSVIDKISKVRETNHIMSIIIGELTRLTGSSQGVINLVEPLAEQDLRTVIRSVDPSSKKFPFKLDRLMSGWVLKNKQMLKVDDLDKDRRFTGISSEEGRFKAVLCLPMLAGGEIIGLTTLVKDADSSIFDDDKCRLAGIIVSQSAQILKNAILYEELARKSELLELSRQQLSDENLRLRTELGSGMTFENIIGRSAPMKEIFRLLSMVCSNDSPVLITGHTGTGKELIAKAIHYNSNRKDKAFVVKNCGVKTETLLESELFGHVKGAFTGADRSKPGLFREADGGTIFLDEIGDAPVSTQVAILRVIENGEIRPVGGTKTETVNVRVLSATNKNLEEEIKRGSFRKDLFYRLNTFVINIPSLSERTDDIPLLVSHFLSKLEIKLGGRKLSVSPSAMETLCSYSWPGNVRQLENEIERAAVVCEDGKTINVSDLSSALLDFDMPEAEMAPSSGSLKEVVEKTERNMILAVLKKTSNNIMQSSRLLGLTRKGLKDKMKRYEITVDTEEPS